MSPDLEQVRVDNARIWLTECGITFSCKNWNLFQIRVCVADRIVHWAPGMCRWRLVGDRDSFIRHGTQPEFAVFLRQLRDGKLEP